jgi:hypothetical protein
LRICERGEFLSIAGCLILISRGIISGRDDVLDCEGLSAMLFFYRRYN